MKKCNLFNALFAVLHLYVAWIFRYERLNFYKCDATRGKYNSPLVITGNHYDDDEAWVGIGIEWSVL